MATSRALFMVDLSLPHRARAVRADFPGVTVDDRAIYAGLPVFAMASVWIGRQFVLSNAAGRRERERVIRVAAPAAAPDVPMSLREYKDVSDLLKQELNGRYMQASEARDRFGAVERKIEDLGDSLKIFIARHIPS